MPRTDLLVMDALIRDLFGIGRGVRYQQEEV